MDDPLLEIRTTADRGRGVFARAAISAGAPVLPMRGILLTTAELTDDLLAMQVGPDLWLCADGSQIDDCSNHSCNPNVGFTMGEPTLYALRDIAPGEEIVWDYSTSMSWPGWSLDCLCGAPNCRRVIRPWYELSTADQERLRGTVLDYLRSTACSGKFDNLGR